MVNIPCPLHFVQFKDSVSLCRMQLFCRIKSYSLTRFNALLLLPAALKKGG